MGYEAETETEQTVFAAEKGGPTMKKKIFAALAAAAMLCGCLAAPASAAEAKDYQMGDVNMDGVVNITDAQLVLEEYVSTALIERSEGILTDEQCKLALLAPQEYQKDASNKREYLTYANNILFYYVQGLVDPAVQVLDPMDWVITYYNNP